MKRGKQWDIKWTCIKGRPQNRKRNEPVHNSAYFTHTHARTHARAGAHAHAHTHTHTGK